MMTTEQTKKEIQKIKRGKKKILGRPKVYQKGAVRRARRIAKPSVPLVAAKCSICNEWAPFDDTDVDRICHNCSDFYLEFKLLSKRKKV